MLAPRIVLHAEDRERHERLAVAALDDDEGGEERERQRAEDDRLRRAPAGVVGVDERVDEQRQTGRDRHGAADVEGALGGLVVALGQQARGEQRGGDADRHVDEQDPLPAEVLGEHAAEQHARGAARAGDGAPDAQRAVALGALGEGVGHDRQRGGGDERGAEALQGARGDEPDVGLRQAAEQRGEREDDEADHEELAAAQEVGEAAAEQQEAAEGEGVGVDDPGEVVLGEVERAARWRAARR